MRIEEREFETAQPSEAVIGWTSPCEIRIY